MIKKSLAVCCVIMFCFGAVFAQQANEPKLYKIGNVEVWAIADSVGERDLSVFEGADEKILKKYVPSGKAPTAVMTYLIKDGEETVLIDTGFGKGLMEGLEKLNVKPEDITIVLITHMHRDHIGGLVKDDKIVFPNAAVKIGKNEYDFWLSDKSAEEFPSRQENFDMAKQTVSAYGDSVKIFNYDDMVTSNIKALDASGHTPGQAVFLLESGENKLLFIADLIHCADLQFPRPDISGRFDIDAEKSAKTRKQFLEKASKEKLLIAGTHLPFPGAAKVKKAGKGYSYTTEK
ncbi:MAG: MBL fold metallo-hydrolase [Endomicrobia bacterium]|nr:MBL fold metallo-hydrolase [Endomicrobiia bacterium]MCL2145270.1 MBL fold metallo-hydrolase [Endomicrobiia bacterium]